MPTITNPTQPNAASIANANLPGMASAPVSATPVVPAPVATPTVADLYGTGSSLDAQAAAADAAKTAANSPAALAATQASSRSDVLGQYQSQLDALDQAAATARANITSSLAPAAASRVGGAGSLAASRGLAGSSFGNAMIDTANTQNASDLNTAISTSNDKYATQKSSLLQFIQGEADKEATARQTASTQGADAKITEIQNRTTRAQASAQSSVQAMIAAGVNDSTNPNYGSSIDAIVKSTGLTKDQVTAMYTTAQQAADAAKVAATKAAGDAAAAGRTTLSPGQQVIGPDGKVIASLPPKDTYQVVKGTTTTDAFGNQSVSPDRVFDATTGQFIGTTNTGSGGGGTPNNLPSSGSQPTPSATTLPSATTPAKADPNDSHLPIAQTVNGKSFDKNGDPTSGAAATTPTNTPPVDANPKVTFAQYGLLSKTDYNPASTVDQLAQSYLNKYIKSGVVPTASTLGRGMKPAGFAQVETRAQDLYFKATGQPLPVAAIIKGQQEIIAKNYQLGNNLKIQEGTVTANINLSLANMNQNGLNSSGFKPLDDLIDNVKNTLQDPAVGQFLAQNTTIQNELGQLLNVRGATGATVFDKLASAGIIGKDDAPDVIKTKVAALIKEAGNLSDALTNANGTAYGFTDPLLQDSNNPARAQYLKTGTTTPATSSDTSGAITAPDGQQIIITD